MEAERKEEIVFGASASAFVFISVFLFRYLGVSGKSALFFPIKLPNMFMSVSQSASFVGAASEVLRMSSGFVLSLIPLAIGLGVLSLYGSRHGENRVLAMAALIPPSIVGVIVSGFTYTSIFFYLGVVISGAILTGLGSTYSKELKKWVSFRIGYGAAGKVLFVVSLFLMFGVFLQAATNIDEYRGEYLNTTEDLITGFISPQNINVSGMSEEDIMSSLPQSYREQLEKLPEEQREKAISEIRNQTQAGMEDASVQIQSMIQDKLIQSQRFRSLVDFALFSTVLVIFGVFMFFVKVLYGPVAGFVTLLRKAM